MDWQQRAACLGKPDEWVVEKGRRPQTAAAVEACSWCSVLAQCRDYAARHKWCGLVVAAWVAPPSEPKRPPWAEPAGSVGSGQDG